MLGKAVIATGTSEGSGLMVSSLLYPYVLKQMYIGIGKYIGKHICIAKLEYMAIRALQERAPGSLSLALPAMHTRSAYLLAALISASSGTRAGGGQEGLGTGRLRYHPSKGTADPRRVSN